MGRVVCDSDVRPVKVALFYGEVLVSCRLHNGGRSQAFRSQALQLQNRPKVRT
jgi:hypothetical protein